MGKIHGTCLNCKKEYYGQGRKFCSNICKGEYSKGRTLNITDEHRKFLSESMRLKRKGKKLSEETKRKIGLASKNKWEDKDFYIKMCKTHEGHEVTFETRQKIKNKQKGRKNPWTIEYNKNRIPPSGWHHTEESKQKIREKVSGKNNGQFGKPPAPVKPFIFIDKRNRKIILRSSWELRLAEYFDKNDIYWEYEKITYNLSNGSTYTPDFFTSNIIYEVKGWFHGKNKEKYELFCKEYPHIKIILADRNFLEETLNIKL